MKKFTQEEFDALPVVDGVRQCPTGDYTAILSFGERCSFGESCSFGAACSFGESCSFGQWCSFGARCSFGQWCSFGERCSFGESCSFGARCSFGERCSFGARCSFGQWCSFGERCSFGESCSFGARCSFGAACIFGRSCIFENCFKVRSGHPFLAVAGAGSVNRTTYFFNTEQVYVRSGCFIGTLQEFRAKVKADDPLHATAPSVKTLQYLGMANTAAVTFNPTLLEI